MDSVFALARPLALPSVQVTSQPVSDENLFKSIAVGEQGALRILFARHNVPLFRFLLRFVKSEAAAEDLVSEVFIDVWRKAGQFKARSQVKTWLLAIARYKALSELRRLSTEELDENVAASVIDPSDGPETAYHKNERSQILSDCIKLLSPEHREIIDLVYYHERTIEDVARIIDIPLNTAKTRMFYARKRIGQLLAARAIGRILVD